MNCKKLYKVELTVIYKWDNKVYSMKYPVRDRHSPMADDYYLWHLLWEYTEGVQWIKSSLASTQWCQFE